MQVEDYQDDRSTKIVELQAIIKKLTAENLHLRHLADDQRDIINDWRNKYTELASKYGVKS